MFGFKVSERSKKRGPPKVDWKAVQTRHNAILEAERGTPEHQPPPPSRKKVGFGKRRKELH